MKKIVAVIVILAFALTGLAAVSAGATEQASLSQAETITYQPTAYKSDGAVVMLTSGPRVGK
jgi:ABC-type glycerol-3-phosphate transport system substrate-binding protein